jgi:hypothetical protein
MLKLDKEKVFSAGDVVHVATQDGEALNETAQPPRSPTLL